MRSRIKIALLAVETIRILAKQILVALDEVDEEGMDQPHVAEAFASLLDEERIMHPMLMGLTKIMVPEDHPLRAEQRCVEAAIAGMTPPDDLTPTPTEAQLNVALQCAMRGEAGEA